MGRRYGACHRFYFWASGQGIERSEEGLFRSLLSQLLEQCPEAAVGAAPQTWEELCLFGTDGGVASTIAHRVASHLASKEKLRTMLTLTVKAMGSSHKICFFVDGLDEFGGRSEELIELLQSILKHDNAKVCLSSGPDPCSRMPSSTTRASSCKTSPIDDRISDLQKRLDLLPPEPQRLYDSISHSIDPFYLDQAV